MNEEAAAPQVKQGGGRREGNGRDAQRRRQSPKKGDEAKGKRGSLSSYQMRVLLVYHESVAEPVYER